MLLAFGPRAGEGGPATPSPRESRSAPALVREGERAQEAPICRTCHDLGVGTCPPSLPTRDADFGEDLARETAVQAHLQGHPAESPILDATTWLVLWSRLHRTPPAPAGAG